MRRRDLLFLVLCLFGFAQMDYATEYIIKHGNTLTSIAHKTGFTVRQLADMNDICPEATIRTGQKLNYFTNQDIKAAKLWCQQRINELHPADKNYDFFKYAVVDLEQRNFRFSINEPDNLHASNIWVFADAWNKFCRNKKR